MVDDETILEEIARNRHDLKSAAKALVRAANKGGGEDNITVVFFEIGGENDLEQTVTLPPRDDGAMPGGRRGTLDELDGCRRSRRRTATGADASLAAPAGACSWRP